MRTKKERVRKRMGQFLKGFLRKDEGITTVEAILLMVVLVAVVLLFKDQITDLVSQIMDKVTNQAMRI